ncbi:MAG: cupin domain-containing protein [Acidobacteriia bacterium]|nr:cupin domain-containing protein [Terriglobia bacterium]
MSTLSRSVLSALLFAAPLFLAPVRAAEPDPKAISITLPDKINWRKSPNADTAILQGDPSKPGLYIQLIRWHAGNMSRPHTHNSERYIYVISGTWWIGTGPHYDPASTYPVTAGTYVIDRPNEIHYDGAKDADCVIYLVGIGPTSTTPAEAK